MGEVYGSIYEPGQAGHYQPAGGPLLMELEGLGLFPLEEVLESLQGLVSIQSARQLKGGDCYL